MNLDMPEEAIRSLVFCGANQFHLFVLSLPGQVLLDHCAELANNMYMLNILNIMRRLYQDRCDNFTFILTYNRVIKI